MKKNVIISLRGTQTTGDEAIELVTEGELLKSDKGFLVTYEESSLTGMEGTTTTLLLEENRVVLTRSGSNNSQMIFEKGKKHLSCYETPHGSMTVGIFADNVFVNIGEDGGEASAKYEVQVDNNLLSHNDFHIKVRSVYSS